MAAALLAFAALSGLAADAQAQTDLWTATLTMGSFQTNYGWDEDGNYSGATLSDHEFDYDGHTYNFNRIRRTGDSLQVKFDLDASGDIANPATRNRLEFHVGTNVYDLDRAGFAGTTLSWQASSLDWSGVSTVALKIVEKPPAAPSEPKNLRALPGNMVVNLSWRTPDSDGGRAITSYEYRQRADGESTWNPDFGTIPDSGPSTVSYTVPDLTNGTTYTFQVRARNTIGAGAVSSTRRATPTAATLLRAPARARVRPGDRQLLLEWSVVTGADGYSVQWKAEGQEYSGSRDYAVGTPHAVLSGLTNGVTYTVRVLASNAGGYSDWSPEASGTPRATPATATGVTVKPGDRHLRVDWSAVPDATSYDLQWRTESEEYRSNRQRTIETPYAVIGHLTNGVTYMVRVRASNVGVDGNWSMEAAGTAGSDAGPEPVPALPMAGVAGLGLLLLGMARRTLRSRNEG